MNLKELIRKAKSLIIENEKVYFLMVYLKCLYLFLNIRRNSFSQWGEDIVLAELLPEVNGSYIDIGAGRPIEGSNTYALYKRGYSGILVEPISLNQRLVRIFRARDQRYEILCGINSTKFDFYEMYPYEYSTTSKEIMQELLRKGSAKLRNTREVEMLPASAIAFQMSPQEATLISIDAEGSDYEILTSIDWQSTLPRVVCVESSNSKDHLETRHFLASKGYNFHTQVGLSGIYVHSTYHPN